MALQKPYLTACRLQIFAAQAAIGYGQIALAQMKGRIMEYPKTPFYFWRWLLLTEYVTGARLGELLALKWEDLTITTDQKGHITGGPLYIQHALYQGRKKDADSPPPLYRGGTKPQQGNRILPLPIDYCYEIQHYRKVQLQQRMLVPNWQENGFLFTKPDGSPVVPNRISNYFMWLRKKLGIQTTFHMLRHDMASRMKKLQPLRPERHPEPNRPCKHQNYYGYLYTHR